MGAQETHNAPVNDPATGRLQVLPSHITEQIPGVNCILQCTIRCHLGDFNSIDEKSRGARRCFVECAQIADSTSVITETIQDGGSAIRASVRAKGIEYRRKI